MASQSSLRELKIEFQRICKRLPAAIKKNGEIKIPNSHLTGLNKAIQKYRKDMNLVPSQFAADLIALLDNSEKDICSQLDPKAFFAFVNLILNSEYCLECERGVYLLAKSIHYDTSEKPKEELLERKRMIGDDCTDTLLTFFTDIREKEGMRQWVGILLQQLLTDCHDSVQKLHENYAENLRSLGTILLEDTNDINKTICAELMRTIYAAEVPLEGLWPPATNSKVYENFPVEFVQGKENKWHRQLVTYLDTLSEADTQSFKIPDSNGCFYFPSGVKTNPASELECLGDHYLYFWITKDNISIITPLCAEKFYTRLEVSRDIIGEMSFDERTFLLSQNEKDFSDLVIKINGQQEAYQCKVNSTMVELKYIYVAFRSDMREELTEDVQRMDTVLEEPSPHQPADDNSGPGHGSISIEHIDTNSVTITSPPEPLDSSQGMTGEELAQTQALAPEDSYDNHYDATPLKIPRAFQKTADEEDGPDKCALPLIESDEPDELHEDLDTVPELIEPPDRSSRGRKTKEKVSRGNSMEILKMPFKKPSQLKGRAKISKMASEERPSDHPDLKAVSSENQPLEALTYTRRSQRGSFVQDSQIQSKEKEKSPSYDLSASEVDQVGYRARKMSSKKAQPLATQHNLRSQVSGKESLALSPGQSHTSSISTSDQSELGSELPSVLISQVKNPASTVHKRPTKQVGTNLGSASKSRLSHKTNGNSMESVDSTGSGAIGNFESLVDKVVENDVNNDRAHGEVTASDESERTKAQIRRKEAAPLKAKKPLDYGKSPASTLTVTQRPALSKSFWDMPDDDDDENKTSSSLVGSNLKNHTKAKGKRGQITSKSTGTKTRKRAPAAKKHQPESQISQQPQRRTQRRSVKKAKMNSQEKIEAQEDVEGAQLSDRSTMERDHEVAIEEAEKLSNILQDGMSLEQECVDEDRSNGIETDLKSKTETNSQLGQLGQFQFDLDEYLDLQDADEDDSAIESGQPTATSASPEVLQVTASPVALHRNNNTSAITSENKEMLSSKIDNDSKYIVEKACAESQFVTTSVVEPKSGELALNEKVVETLSSKSKTTGDSQLVTNEKRTSATISGAPDTSTLVGEIAINQPALIPSKNDSQTEPKHEKIAEFVAPATIIRPGIAEQKKRKSPEEAVNSGKRQRNDTEQGSTLRRSPRLQDISNTPLYNKTRRSKQKTPEKDIVAAPRRSPRLATSVISSRTSNDSNLVDENLSRKPTIINFSQDGPSNQGTSNRSRFSAKEQKIEVEPNGIGPLSLVAKNDASERSHNGDAHSPGVEEMIRDLTQDATKKQRHRVVSPGSKTSRESSLRDQVDLVEYKSDRKKEKESVLSTKGEPLQPRKRTNAHVDNFDRPSKRQSISPPQELNDENSLPQEYHQSPVTKSPFLPRRNPRNSTQERRSPSVVSALQQRSTVRNNLYYRNTPQPGSKRQIRPTFRGSSQSSRVDFNGSPIATQISPQVDYLGRLEGRLKQNKNAAQSLGESMDLQHGESMEIFGPAISVSGSNKAKPSPPESAKVRYVPHKRNPQTGVYENLNGNETIPQEKPLDNPFEQSANPKSTKFTDRLQNEIKNKKRTDEILRTLFHSSEGAKQAESEPNDDDLGGETLVQIEVNQSARVLPPESLTSGSSSDEEDLDSAFAEENAAQTWDLALRPHYASLTRAVHRVADELLIKLADRETAIDTVVKQYETNGELCVNRFEQLRSSEQSEMLQDFGQKKEMMAKLYREARHVATSIVKDVRASPVARLETEWNKRNEVAQRELEQTRRLFLGS